MNVYYIMSITEKPKHAFSAIVMAVYFLIDKIIPYLVKITFPFWALPFISFTIAWKFIRLWKNIISFLLSLLNPDTPPTLAYAILKGNGQYLRKHSQDVLVHQFYDYTSRSKNPTIQNS